MTCDGSKTPSDPKHVTFAHGASFSKPLALSEIAGASRRGGLNLRVNMAGAVAAATFYEKALAKDRQRKRKDAKESP